jgi:leucyl-tRNA synthetase
VVVIDEAAAKVMQDAENTVNDLLSGLNDVARAFGEPEDDARMTTAIGEIIKRNDNVIVIERMDESQVTLELVENAQIVDRAGNIVPIESLRYRLGVEKMSKSKGNVVAPDVLVAQYGADTVRGYLMFAFRWESGGPWDSQGIQGVVRWLNDVWSVVTDSPPVQGAADEKALRAVRRKVHQTIQRVGEGLETFSFNTAVAALMELKNTLVAARKTPVCGTPVWREAIRTMLLLMAPITPHIAEELWQHIGEPYSVHNQPFPAFDPEAAREEEITLVVSVNGKLRARLQAPAGLPESEAVALALASPEVQKHINGGAIKKVIYVAERGMLNLVV